MAKYSEIKASNGIITLNSGNTTLELDTINWQYLNVSMIYNRVRVYINHSTEFVEVGTNDFTFILKDFAINHAKFEFVPSGGMEDCQFTYYLLK